MVALINDTVGTMVSAAYENKQTKQCHIGAIIGLCLFFTLTFSSLNSKTFFDCVFSSCFLNWLKFRVYVFSFFNSTSTYFSHLLLLQRLLMSETSESRVDTLRCETN